MTNNVFQSPLNQIFSHDVTAAILVDEPMKRCPCWCTMLVPMLMYHVGVGVPKTDQFRFLGNRPPTPPLSQHFALSDK